jgi:hypothetical protein
MTDKELLELAAMAAGIHVHHYSEGHDVMMCSSVEGGDPDYSWNPLTNDGDALRLAVKLRIIHERHSRYAFVAAFAPDVAGRFEEPEADDPYAATRRAIVRAAAEIGSKL